MTVHPPVAATTRLAPLHARTSLSTATATRLDPRAKVIAVVAVSAAVMAPGGTKFLVAGALVSLGLAATEAAWKRLVWLVLAMGGFAFLAFVAPLVWSNPVVGTLSIGAFYAVRLTVALGVGMHLLATTSPTELTAAMRAWHLPRGLAVSLSVMLRFFPLVAAEALAVLDAMRLRGLLSVSGLLRHPILAAERFTVPVIASSLRVADDLSASAILRGLGSPNRPTSVAAPRFGMIDVGFLLLLAALAVFSIVLWPVTT